MSKLAVVTGASRGIGAAVTDMLLTDGWSVVGLSRTAPEPRDGLYWFGADVADPDVVEDVLASNGIEEIDALVHCAGIRGPFGHFLDNKAEAWERTIQVNLIGTYRAVRACLTRLQKVEDGRVLLFSGGGAFSPEPNYSAYAASKGATIALVETLAEELSGSSVTINAVAPGFVATDIHQGTPHEHRQAAPDAMANVVACVRHLLGPQTQGLTGRTISAAWDDWRNLSPWTIPHIDNQGTRDRHMIAGLQRLLIHGRRAI